MGKTSALSVINLILIIGTIIALWMLYNALQPVLNAIEYLESLGFWYNLTSINIINII